MIGIISAMNKEVELLIQLLFEPKKIKILNNEFWQGTLFGKKVVITVSGIGKVNASIGSLLMIEHFKPRLVINTGVAGGYNEKLKPLDIVIGSKVSYYDFDLTADGYALGVLPNSPDYFSSCEKAKLIISDLNFNGSLFYGVILSGDRFVTNKDALTKLLINHPLKDCFAVDMESASIAQVCYQNKVPFIIIRSISDVIGTSNQINSYYDLIEQAVKQTLTIITEIIKQY